ncbi:hypothetical protein SDC9_102481 [bioreactor metagenome]|uniref:Uncharacterized protein n=1 Tax=bioreactor metagenome TaxID=1076179 RepID=A0A645B1U3_9ZZZZ
MPICELRLPNNYPMENGKDVCDVALDTTLKGLGIPDPKDREFRIKSIDSLTDPEVQVSFGCGKNQYEEFGKDGEFMPTSEQLKTTCENILNEVRQFGVKKVILDGWKGAAFMIRSPEKKDFDLIIPERFKDGIVVKGDIAIRMVFSPSVLDSLKLDLENNEEVFKNILELFEGDGGVELQFPLEAETDIGVEVDFCDVGNENNFSDEEMSYIMHRIESCLDSGVTSDRDKETTIWVRQGSPELLYKVYDGTI